MNKRKYNFELPYNINYFYVIMGMKQLKDEGIFGDLPKHIQTRFEEVGWGGATITKEDCDSIDEETWSIIAEKLGLSWEEIV